MEPRLLSKDEVLAYLGGISSGTLHRWMASGLVPGPIKGTVRWDRRQIDAWLDQASGLRGTWASEANPLDEAWGLTSGRENSAHRALRERQAARAAERQASAGTQAAAPGKSRHHDDHGGAPGPSAGRSSGRRRRRE